MADYSPIRCSFDVYSYDDIISRWTRPTYYSPKNFAVNQSDCDWRDSSSSVAHSQSRKLSREANKKCGTCTVCFATRLLRSRMLPLEINSTMAYNLLRCCYDFCDRIVPGQQNCWYSLLVVDCVCQSVSRVLRYVQYKALSAVTVIAVRSR